MGLLDDALRVLEEELQRGPLGPFRAFSAVGDPSDDRIDPAVDVQDELDAIDRFLEFIGFDGDSGDVTDRELSRLIRQHPAEARGTLMSVTRGGSPLGASFGYEDIEAHHMFFGIKGNTNVASSQKDIHMQDYEVLDDDLDNDELGILMGLDVWGALGMDSEVSAGNAITSMRSVLAWGVNMADNEAFPVDVPGGTSEFTGDLDPDDDGTDEFAFVGNHQHENSMLGRAELKAINPVDDDTNGGAGGAAVMQCHETYNYRDLFGHGPALDSTDDFTIGAVLDVNGSLTEFVELFVSMTAWYVTVKTEERRPDLGLPPEIRGG